MSLTRNMFLKNTLCKTQDLLSWRFQQPSQYQVLTNDAILLVCLENSIFNFLLKIYLFVLNLVWRIIITPFFYILQGQLFLNIIILGLCSISSRGGAGVPCPPRMCLNVSLLFSLRSFLCVRLIALGLVYIPLWAKAVCTGMAKGLGAEWGRRLVLGYLGTLTWRGWARSCLPTMGAGH